jgi:hypothetical protein
MRGNPFARARLFVLGPERRRVSWDGTVSVGVSGTGFGRLTCAGKSRWVFGKFAEHYVFPAGTHKATVSLRGLRGKVAVTVLFDPEWQLSSVRHSPRARIAPPPAGPGLAPELNMAVPHQRVPTLALRRGVTSARLRELYDELAT